ncbi:IQ-domain 2 [Artemisia annua]|uniref:IQ-domain 2 n=1 Tax=Artemisia annua TaxID=35608 RepID=A0A2U1MV02_ARTAN|nr:IQ-domain 2 [Artemisia annua]
MMPPQLLLENNEDIEADSIVADDEENEDETDVGKSLEEAEPVIVKKRDWRRVREMYERSKQYIFVAATLPDNGKRTAGGELKRLFPEAKWLQHRVYANISRVESQINSRRIRMSEENQALEKQLFQKRAKEMESLQMGEEWNDSLQSKEEIEAKLLNKYEATMRRERAMTYSFSH